MATPTVPTAQPATPLNPFVVELPEKLEFRRPEEWKRWFTRWERYRVISEQRKAKSALSKNTARPNCAGVQVVWLNDAPTITHYVPGKRKNMQCLRQKGTLCRRVLICLCEEEKEHPPSCFEEVYLGQLTDQRDSGPWRTGVTVNGLPMKFKVDTGADVTAIPTSLYNEEVMGNLKQAKKPLLGPGRTKIATIGLFSATLCWNGRECQEEIYVINKLHDALLGRPAIKSLDILPSLLEVTASTSKVNDPANILCHYPNFTTGLGLLKT
ncbi:hypothetical protein MRX96_043989 [Rhipicephalus microplus]